MGFIVYVTITEYRCPVQDATNYITALRDVSAQLSAQTRDELDDIVEDAEREFLIYLVALGVFVLGCLVLAIWYSYYIFTTDCRSTYNSVKLKDQNSKHGK